MRLFPVRILLLCAAIAAVDAACDARDDIPVAAVADTISCCPAFTVPLLDAEMLRRLMCRTPESVLRSLAGRDLGPDYRLCIMAGGSWRPFRDFGNADNKVRVFGPTVGLAFRYSFSM